MPELIRGVNAEIRGRTGQNRVFIGDAAERMSALAEERPGSVSLIYMDPPFCTGKRFSARLRVGAGEWESGKGSLSVSS